MLIILISHIQSNPWASYIPARFGPSDAAEMFVFCSGYAAAIAFGGTFARAGFWMGVRRIVLRCWQIYWSHIGLFFAVVVVTVAITRALGPTSPDFIGRMNLEPFLDDTATNIVALFTFTYVPNYFDILPMYFVVLLMTPLVVALQRVHTGLAVAFCVGLYAASWTFGLNLPAEPWTDREWFFNPFAWQLLFFTGFAFSRGWIPVPPVRLWLLLLTAGYVLVMVPLSRWQIYWDHPVLHPIHDFLWVDGFKTYQHPVRYLHVLALTYLAAWAVRGREEWLLSPAMRPVVVVGQQALAAFMASMVLSWLMTIFLDLAGRDALTVTSVNVVGLAAVIAVAYVVSWYKSEPWRKVAPKGPDAAPGGGSGQQPRADKLKARTVGPQPAGA